MFTSHMLAIANRKPQLGRDQRAFTQLFEDWLQSDGDWLKSSIVMSARTEKEKALTGQWKLMSKAAA